MFPKGYVTASYPRYAF